MVAYIESQNGNSAIQYNNLKVFNGVIDLHSLVRQWNILKKDFKNVTSCHL